MTLEEWQEQREKAVALRAALNLICGYAEEHLPTGWTLILTIGESSELALIDPDGDEFHYDTEDSAIVSACATAKEHSTAYAEGT